MQTYDHILVDVDTQFDFLDPAGNLYVPGAQLIFPALERLFDYARRSGVPVISTADEHSSHDPEYVQFGRHCERGTLGQRKLMFTVLPKSRIVRPEDKLPAGAEPLLREYQQLIFYKANLDVFVNPHLGELVSLVKVREYIVFGVATDYCVATMVEGLLARNAKVAVVADAIRALDAAKGQEALRRFAERGVRLIHATEVVHSLDDEPTANNTGDDLDDSL